MHPGKQNSYVKSRSISQCVAIVSADHEKSRSVGKGGARRYLERRDLLARTVVLNLNEITREAFRGSFPNLSLRLFLRRSSGISQRQHSGNKAGSLGR
jgi:hypothetical protein